MDTPSSRDKILDVAEARFAQRGYTGVGLRELADAAGLGKSSLFHHFPSKMALYLAVLDRQLERIERAAGPSLEGVGNVVARLDRTVEALIDVLAEHQTSARLLLRALFEDDDLPEQAPEVVAFEGRIRSLVGRVGALVQEGIADGVFRSVSVGDTIQTIVGVTVYHFASGDLGDEVIGGSLFTAEAVARRKREVLDLLHGGLVSAAP